MGCNLPLISVPQGRHNWRIEVAGLVQMGSGVQQCMEDLGWRLGNCEDCVPGLALILTKPQEGRKAKPKTSQPVASKKTNNTLLVGLKSAGGFSVLFFFFTQVRQQDIEL